MARTPAHPLAEHPLDRLAGRVQRTLPSHDLEDRELNRRMGEAARPQSAERNTSRGYSDRLLTEYRLRLKC